MPVLHLATPPPPLAPPPLAQSAPPAGRGTFEVRSPSSIRTYSPGMMSPAVAVPPAGLDSFANRPTAKIRTFHDAPVPSTPPRPPPQPEPVVYSPAVHSPAVHSPAGAGTAPKPAAGRSSSHDQSRDDLRRPATCDTPNSRALGSSRSLGFQGYIGSKARGGRSPLALPRHLRSEVHDIIYRGVWSENAMVMPERFQPGVRSTPGPCRNSASNPSRPSSAPSSGTKTTPPTSKLPVPRPTVPEHSYTFATVASFRRSQKRMSCPPSYQHHANTAVGNLIFGGDREEETQTGQQPAMPVEYL